MRHAHHKLWLILLRDRHEIEKLDFIVPGAQKSGTTALHYFLEKHPQIALPDRQELHFFDDEEVFSRAPVDYQFLHGNFRSRRKRLRSVRSAGRTDSSRGEREKAPASPVIDTSKMSPAQREAIAVEEPSARQHVAPGAERAEGDAAPGEAAQIGERRGVIGLGNGDAAADEDDIEGPGRAEYALSLPG